MELRTLTVALMHKKWLLSIVSENWAHIFKSGRLNSYFWIRESEHITSSPENLKRPAGNTGQRKIRKIAPRHVQNTFGLFWERFWAFLQFWIFFWFLRKLSTTPWNTGHKNFFRKIAPKHVRTLGNVFGHFGTLKFFDFFLQFFLNIYLKI